jgi:hypothetical protein
MVVGKDSAQARGANIMPPRNVPGIDAAVDPISPRLRTHFHPDNMEITYTLQTMERAEFAADQRRKIAQMMAMPTKKDIYQKLNPALVSGEKVPLPPPRPTSAGDAGGDDNGGTDGGDEAPPPPPPEPVDDEKAKERAAKEEEKTKARKTLTQLLVGNVYGESQSAKAAAAFASTAPRTSGSDRLTITSPKSIFERPAKEFSVSMQKPLVFPLVRATTSNNVFVFPSSPPRAGTAYNFGETGTQRTFGGGVGGVGTTSEADQPVLVRSMTADGRLGMNLTSDGRLNVTGTLKPGLPTSLAVPPSHPEAEEYAQVFQKLELARALERAQSLLATSPSSSLSILHNTSGSDCQMSGSLPSRNHTANLRAVPAKERSITPAGPLSPMMKAVPSSKYAHALLERQSSAANMAAFPLSYSTHPGSPTSK